DIKELRIFPPLAIARLGSSPTPLANYEVVTDNQNPGAPRQLVPAETLFVAPATGEITGSGIPADIKFRDENQDIHPVAPFLEVWARFEEGGNYRPLTLSDLNDLHLTPDDLQWQVQVANHKVFRRTKQQDDKVEADTGLFGDHTARPLVGHCA